MKRYKNGKIIFEDYPEFKPNLSPDEIFTKGAFGGTYFRPIKSNITSKKYINHHLKYKSLLKNIQENKLVLPYENYDKNINKYKVKVGTTLEFWETKNWINYSHPYGWVEWYCDFYNGNRNNDDKRQISRWIKTAGENSRFRKRLINLIKKNKSTYNDYKISPKIRQTLLHWNIAANRLYIY